MKITDVSIQLIKPNNGLIAFATVLIENVLILRALGIHQKLYKPNEFRITYPRKLLAQKDLTIFHPINKEFSEEIEKAVFDKLKDVINYDRHYCANS